MAESGTVKDDPGQPEPVEPVGEPPNPGFPVVGIGASAGGVAAFEAFFSTMPANSDPGIAFVIVQHLARDHKSILSELIRRYTRMQVYEVEDGMEIEANCAYINPPNRDMALRNGVLRLLEPSTARGFRLPIDYFFRSLAQDRHEHAICIILSGTGSDGTLGARAVKGEGGMVMAQTPETAAYDGMPRSAIATGMVDFVLPPNEMPVQLLAYVARAFEPPPEQPLLTARQAEDGLDRIFLLLRTRTGHDFSQYKRSTIIRRVERRMAVHQIDRRDDYVRYLQLAPGEVDSLFRDLLIGVTNFFRDTGIFEEIQKQVIPKLFEGKASGSVIRIWIPGCSTGEEAYSIAMLIRERIDELKANYKVNIFATDIDRGAIDKARAGVYPPSISADVPPERLARFFEQENQNGSAYRIHKTIRDMLIFSEHDLIKDPPFSKLDLISCRNLLIYMSGELQKKLMPLFHYALHPGGHLVLGSSESIGDFGNLFAVIDRKAKIYRRKTDETARRGLGLGGTFSRLPEHETIPRMKTGEPAETKVPLRQIAERAALDHYTPVGGLVNERGDIVYLLGRTGRYLEPTPGEASVNIFRMAREGLRGELTVALHRAVSTNAMVSYPGLRVEDEGEAASITLTIRPVTANPDNPPGPGLFLFLFEEAAEANVRSSTDAAAIAVEGADLDGYILRLKQELRAKDEHLQTAVEELETSNEELRSAHEEMQSVNEEMQSTNEELKTSKEELQSVNEELATVNGELQAKVSDLSRSNNDMKNLLGGTGIGTIFVDHQLRILRFTSTIGALINLIESDVGRPVQQIRSNLVGYDGLAEDINGVLETLTPKEREVQTVKGEWYLLRIRPYRTLENVIEGAVITFTEITATKQAQRVLQDSEAMRRLAIVVRDSRDAILVQDMAGNIVAWNAGAQRMYGWSEEEALAKDIRDLMPDMEKGEALEGELKRCASGTLEPRQVQRLRKDGQTMEVSSIVSALVNDAGKVYALSRTERALAPHAAG